jgi:hypothetical protein
LQRPAIIRSLDRNHRHVVAHDDRNWRFLAGTRSLQLMCNSNGAEAHVLFVFSLVRAIRDRSVDRCPFSVSPRLCRDRARFKTA